jgi:predicted DNA-binding protein
MARKAIYEGGAMLVWPLRIPAAMKKQLEDLARADQREVTNYVRVVLANHIRAAEKGRVEAEKGKTKVMRMDG